MTYEQVVELVLRDVEATLGASARREAAAFTRLERRLGNVPDDDPRAIVDRLQTYIHDCFIDPTWPACPLHETHPLWFGKHDAWWCAMDDVKIAPLGELTGRAP
ncbi:MAG TPA: hypothetical protein VFK57_10255 [Vicinamibacterales bacterium]|nr:hypothetical protein [Vicinamibacterales bacterium]